MYKGGGDFIKKISVLGTGWLGFPLSEHFISKGFDVKGSTRSFERMAILKENNIDPFLLNLAYKDFGLDSFFDSDTLIVNIPFKGIPEFSTLIEKIEQSNITHVIFISSTSVYDSKQGVISEEDHDSLIPCDLLALETLFRSNKNFTTTVLRFGGLIGPDRNPALFFKNNRQVKNPESRVNMIHRDDCVNIIYLIIEKKAWGKTYNGCSDTHPTKREFYTHAATISALPVPSFSEEDEILCSKIISNAQVKKDLEYDFLHPNLLKLKF